MSAANQSFEQTTKFSDVNYVNSPLNSADIILAVFLSLLCLISLFGNALVVVAVYKESKLHSFTNYFIVSLACADLLISLLVMPLAIIYQVLGEWPFSWWVCLSFTTLDILCCTGSILNLCAISLDRYWAIITPFEYPRRMTRRTCPIIIAAVWLLSALIAFAQIIWRYAINELTNEPETGPGGEPMPQQCGISTDLYFRMFSSSSSFYVPLFVMLFTYSRIYAAAKRQQRAIKRQAMMSVPSSYNRTPRKNAVSDGCSIPPATPQRGSVQGQTNETRETDFSKSRSDSIGPLERSSKTRASYPSHTNGSSGGTAAAYRASMVRRLSTAVPQTFRKAKRKLTNQAAELKAFRILSVVMGAFIINWLPFFVLYLFEGFCTQCTVPIWTVTLVVWLGYFNSSINPFIYVFCNRQFRIAFMRLLTPSRVRRMRQPDRSERLLMDGTSVNEIGNPSVVISTRKASATVNFKNPKSENTHGV